eukprot:COSAG02_NODE_56710_length_284_cov_0.821622_1_plen_61_part_01
MYRSGCVVQHGSVAVSARQCRESAILEVLPVHDRLACEDAVLSNTPVHDSIVSHHTDGTSS